MRTPHSSGARPLGTLTLVPASRTSDIDGTNTAVGNLYLFKEHSRQTSLETHLASNPHARIHTLIGAFYFDEDIDLYTRPYNQFNVSFQHPLIGGEQPGALRPRHVGRDEEIAGDGWARASHTRTRTFEERSRASTEIVCRFQRRRARTRNPFPPTSRRRRSRFRPVL